LAYDINDDWDLLVQHTTQQLETQGVWEYAPVLGGDEESQIFAPDENKDEFGLTTSKNLKPDLVVNSSISESLMQALTRN